MREVTIDPIPLDRLAGLLEPERADRLARHAEEAQTIFHDRIVWNVNATATGGGVAEMLQSLLAYGRGAGVDTRWLVLDGNPEFFKLTKRIHNALHGKDGDNSDRLWDQDPTSGGVWLRDVARARALGRKHRWAPPMAWDDDTIHNPDALPNWTGRCGTPGGYYDHGQIGTPTCQPCRDAVAEAAAARKTRRRNRTAA